jgi:hypothetical protein
MTQANGLWMWTIYAHPADFPDVEFVVRGWIVGPHGTLTDSGALGFAHTLDEARNIVPAGLVRMERSPDDDPVVVETWI